ARPAPSGWGDIVFAQIRRFVMKRWLIGSGILFVLAILGITVSIFPQRGGTATGAPQAGPNQDVTIINDVPLIPFESVPNFFKLSPDMNFGETLSVAVNSKGNIVVLNHEGTATSGPLYGNATTQVWEFDSNGKFLREIGKGVYGLGYSHSVRFDRYDNLWIVDKGTNSIMKFNPAGYVLMNLGRRPEGYEGFEFKRSAPAEKRAVDGLYDGPTDVAWDAEDNIYVSDGYVNSRIAKMNKNGDWIKSWGSYGSGPSQFRNPHNMQIDRQGNIYAADRGNGRIQVFDSEGNFKKFIWPHGLACPSEDIVFVADMNNWRVQKLILNPRQAVSR